MAGTLYRKLILWGALAATVLAALLVDEGTELSVDDVVQPAVDISTDRRTAGQTRQIRQTHETLPVDQLGKRKFSAKADDIFAVTSWEPKRTASTDFNPQIFQPRKEEVVRRPSAPPLQFEYLGRVVSEGKIRVFLAQADQNYVAGAGERIGTEYRIDRIREDTIELTYLPLGIRQTLTIDQGTFD